MVSNIYVHDILNVCMISVSAMTPSSFSLVSIIGVVHAYLAQMFHMYTIDLCGRGRFVSLLISVLRRRLAYELALVV